MSQSAESCSNLSFGEGKGTEEVVLPVSATSVCLSIWIGTLPYTTVFDSPPASYTLLSFLSPVDFLSRDSPHSNYPSKVSRREESHGKVKKAVKFATRSSGKAVWDGKASTSLEDNPK
ncbi:hypothetical protein Trydic_g10852 [Trypoxylus dichotomus]